MSNDELIFAIAGENSKTDVAILRGDGTLLSALRGPGSSPEYQGLEGSMRVIGDLIGAAWADAGLGSGSPRASAATFFLAGFDLVEDEQACLDAVKARRWAAQNEVANDVFAFLWAGTKTGHGVAVFVGAGVNCVGRAPSGRTARFPSFGLLSGDFGDGPSIGLAALGAAVRSEDGRGAETWLTRAIADYFRSPTATDVCIAIQKGKLHIDRLIELAPLVVTAAAIGDWEAELIIDHQVDEVIRLAVAGINQLDMADTPIDVVLAGSLLTGGGTMVVDRVRAGLLEQAPHARPSLCTTPPLVGAAFAALRRTGAGTSALERVRASLQDGRIKVLSGTNYLNVPGR